MQSKFTALLCFSMLECEPKNRIFSYSFLSNYL
nr:MAG TPA: hypothetical protein [Caudoviricetes sp.]